MKPFNLEAALAGEPVVTRGGLTVKDVRHFPSAAPAQQVGYVANGNLYCRSVLGTGSYIGDKDLFMASEKKEGWSAIFKVKGGSISLGSVWPTEAEAIAHKNRSFSIMDGIGVQKIEWEE